MQKGIKQGIEQGIEQTLINNVKGMLENDIEIEVIAKITNRSIEEIEKIINEKEK